MIVATHRVVGLLEWPIGSEPSPDVLAVLERDPLSGDPASGCVLSLRLPVADNQTANVLAADVSQLRRDLQRLFNEFTIGG